MLEINEVKIARILNPTAIDLGEYVINPFMGCEFACLYCYVRSNRVVSRKTKPWGEYVDIRINAPELLEKEIAKKRPKCVLLGSTTECFQPLERKYKITGQVLEILNKNKVYFTILTRSPYILDYLPLLKSGYCKAVYFTINNYPQYFKSRLEPKSPDFNLRDKAVNQLLEEGVPVVPYFSPILPWISDTGGVFSRFPKSKEVGFEGLNFRLVNIRDILDNITTTEPPLRVKYERMLSDKDFYTKVWQEIEAGIAKEARACGKSYNIYIHEFGSYFKNSYL